MFQMQPKVKMRQIRIVAALGALLLAAAVFGWGLQYKLSLYKDSGDQTNSMPHAKLLSQKERPASAVAIHLVGSNSQQLLTPAGFPMLFVAAVLLASVSARLFWITLRALVRNSDKHRLAGLDHFAFRPPPVATSSY